MPDPGGWPLYQSPDDQPGPERSGPPKTSGPSRLVGVMLVGAVVLGGASAAGYSLLGNRTPGFTVGPPSPPVPVPGPPESGTPSPGTPDPSPAGVEPVIPGWQAVVSPRHGANYDVPHGWTVSPGTSVGYESKNGPLIAKSTLAQYGRGRCGKEYQAPTDVGLMGPGTDAWDPAEVASRLATRWAKARDAHDGAGPPAEPPIPRTDTQQLRQGATAQVATVTLHPAHPSPAECNADQVRFTVAAVEFDGGKRAIMVIRNAQQIPDAVGVDLEREIISSLRPQ